MTYGFFLGGGGGGVQTIYKKGFTNLAILGIQLMTKSLQTKRLKSWGARDTQMD